MHRPLLCGYYGEHNLGDDALLEALIGQLPKQWQPLITAHDQGQVEARHHRPTVQRRGLASVLRALRRCDGLVLGGGSLLQDSTSLRSLIYYACLIISARLQGKPVLLWGQGLGPLKRRISRWIVRAVLPLASAISWRDPQSQRLAQQLGVSAPCGSDPVWALTPGQWRGAHGPIVLCWRPTPLLTTETWQPLLSALDSLVKAEPREVLWVPFHQHQDQGLLADLQRRGVISPELAARSREQPVSTVEEAQALFSGAGLVVAMRLHGLILAALSGSPCAALSYDPKVSAAAAAIGCPCSDLAQPLQAISLVASWQQQIDQSPDPTTVAALRQNTATHHDLLQRFCER